MARRPGLGRGLDALIPGSDSKESSTATAHSAQGVLQIPIEKIKANPQQPRSAMDEEKLNELAASIREHGILQPLVVSTSSDSDGYTLIAGERRLRAAELAGLRMVPVIERIVTKQDQLELALIENVQRADLSPLEMAEAYHQLAENFAPDARTNRRAGWKKPRQRHQHPALAQPAGKSPRSAGGWKDQ